MSSSETVLVTETNRGGFCLQIVAVVEQNKSVKYIIRIKNPDGSTSDYVSSLKGFKEFGDMLSALSSFADQKLYALNPEKLKEVLTADNIKNFNKLKESGVFMK